MSANMKMSIDCEIVYKLNEKKILKYNIEMVKLEDYTTTELKKMISSFNKIVKFSGYSKLPKAKLITMIRTHPKVKVEEGANAVKLSIKTDEDFEKQKKVKKEKVKKEVKKEVEKLDDVKVVVKPLTVTKADGTIKELKMKKKKFNVKAKKEEPKKEEPKEDKEKAVDDLLKQIKKSYDKNKPKLDKMTDKKYKTVFNTKLVELYDDVEDIYQEDLTTEQRFNLRKRFSAIIPFKKEEPKKEEPVNKNEKFIKRFFKNMDGLPVNKDGKEIKITDKDVKQRAADTYRDLVFSLQGNEDKKALKEIRTEKKQVMKLINGAKKNYKLPENSATWELLIERLDGDMTDETLDKNDDDPKEDVFYYNPLNYQRIINYIIKNYLGYKEIQK
jgi:hypothetical protein